MKQAITRLVVLVVLLLNQTLVTFGWNPLPFSDDQIYEAVSSVILVFTTIWAWYKNNDTTPEAEVGTEYMKELKRKKEDINE